MNSHDKILAKISNAMGVFYIVDAICVFAYWRTPTIILTIGIVLLMLLFFFLKYAIFKRGGDTDRAVPLGEPLARIGTVLFAIALFCQAFNFHF